MRLCSSDGEWNIRGMIPPQNNLNPHTITCPSATSSTVGALTQTRTVLTLEYESDRSGPWKCNDCGSVVAE